MAVRIGTIVGALKMLWKWWNECSKGSAQVTDKRPALQNGNGAGIGAADTAQGAADLSDQIPLVGHQGAGKRRTAAA